MTERTGGVWYEVTLDTGQLIYDARRKARRDIDSDTLKAKLSDMAGAVSAVVGLEAISKGMQTCAVAQRHFEGYEVKEPVTHEECRPFYDTKAVIERHNELNRESDRRDAVKTARLVEIAKLSARDEWEASKQAAASLLAAVAATPAPVVAQSVQEEPGLAMKKGVLIDALEHDWKAIRKDLREASRNGLKDAAHTGKHSMWDVGKARAWAVSKGKIKQAAPVHGLTAVWPGGVTRHSIGD